MCVINLCFYRNQFVLNVAGYYFTERGYDVWFGNARGNTFSRNHTTLDPEKIQFWKFTLDHIALIDVPTMIDFVLDKTNQSQLIYLGYSQGGFVGMALLSERPEYNKKIALMHGMGAAVIMKNSHAIIAPFLERLAELKVNSFLCIILLFFLLPVKMSSIHSW